MNFRDRWTWSKNGLTKNTGMIKFLLGSGETAEYKEIAKGLSENRVLVEKEAELMRKMAGYRNRMVHFYHEISPEELHEICFFHAEEIKFLVEKLLQWTREHGNSIS